MKLRWILKALSVLLIFLFIPAAILPIWDHFTLLYPTADTESAFLRNYSPQGVIEPFKCNLPSANVRNNIGSAGRKFVTLQAGWKSDFAMKSDTRMHLMEALNKDVSAQLFSNGAQVLSRSGDAGSGFHFEYKLGKSIGTVTILPITPNSRMHRARPLPEGLVDVTADIEAAEKWFPKESGTIRGRFDDLKIQ
jgi:hypothetical protein